jgi:Ca-activated chloride channel family protein
MKPWTVTVTAIAVVLLSAAAWATGIMVPTDEKLPPLAIKYHRIGAAIVDGVAVTKVEESFLNSTDRQLEANFVFPLPKGAAIKELAMYINGERVTAELVEAPKARQIYEDIVRRARDPALLEFMGSELYRLRVFPIPPKGEQRVELEYSQALAYDGGLYRYVYPLKIGERASTTLEDFSASVKISSKVPITSVYSPTHNIGIDRTGEHEVVVGFEKERAALDKDFVLYYAISQEDFGLNLLAYKPTGEDGYFMLMISPSAVAGAEQIVKKDVVFVLDTSGSMAGEKIEQARSALSFCINSLNEGDTFNIVPFATTVNTYKHEMVPVSADALKAAVEFVAGLRATGGTDINGALTAALAMKPKEGGRPFMIVFLTDGKPTIGVTEPDEILKNVAAANTAQVRLFVFGVGYGVNTKLLDELAQASRGVSEYVQPEEDIEVKVSNFFAKASYPVLSNVKLAIGGTAESVRAYDLYPNELPDLFKGVPLQVFGRYQGAAEKVPVVLTGSVNGVEHSFVYEASLPDKNADNEFIARLWATRRVGYLLDEIRLHGENKELVDSVTELAKGYGIVTPYTSYLIVEDRPAGGPVARATSAPRDAESVRLSASPEVMGEVRDGFRRETEEAGSGPGGEERSDLSYSLDGAGTAPDEDMPVVTYAKRSRSSGARSVVVDKKALESDEGEVAVQTASALSFMKHNNTAAGTDVEGIRNVGGRTFYRVYGHWVDGTIRADMPVLRIKYASEAYFSLVEWQPELTPFLAIGDKLLLVVDGHLLLISDEGEETLTKEGWEKFLASQPEPSNPASGPETDGAGQTGPQ